LAHADFEWKKDGMARYINLANTSHFRFCLVVQDANTIGVCDLVGGSGYQVSIILDI